MKIDNLLIGTDVSSEAIFKLVNWLIPPHFTQRNTDHPFTRLAIPKEDLFMGYERYINELERLEAIISSRAASPKLKTEKMNEMRLLLDQFSTTVAVKSSKEHGGINSYNYGDIRIVTCKVIEIYFQTQLVFFLEKENAIEFMEAQIQSMFVIMGQTDHSDALQKTTQLLVGNLFFNLGQLYRKKGNVRRALAALENCFEHARDIPNYRQARDSALELANLYLSMADTSHKTMMKAAQYLEEHLKYSAGLPDTRAYMIGQAEAAFLDGNQRVGTCSVGQCTVVTVRCMDVRYQNRSLIFHKDDTMEPNAIKSLLHQLPKDTPWQVGIYGSSSVYPEVSYRNLCEVLGVLREYPNVIIDRASIWDKSSPHAFIYDAQTGEVTQGWAARPRSDLDCAMSSVLNPVTMLDDQPSLTHFHVAYNLIGIDTEKEAPANQRYLSICTLLTYAADLDKYKSNEDFNHQYREKVHQNNDLRYARKYKEECGVAKLCRQTQKVLFKKIGECVTAYIPDKTDYMNHCQELLNNILHFNVCIGRDAEKINQLFFDFLMNGGVYLENNQLKINETLRPKYPGPTYFHAMANNDVSNDAEMTEIDEQQNSQSEPFWILPIDYRTQLNAFLQEMDDKGSEISALGYAKDTIELNLLFEKTKEILNDPTASNLLNAMKDMMVNGSMTLLEKEYASLAYGYCRALFEHMMGDDESGTLLTIVIDTLNTAKRTNQLTPPEQMLINHLLMLSYRFLGEIYYSQSSDSRDGSIFDKLENDPRALFHKAAFCASENKNYLELKRIYKQISETYRNDEDPDLNDSYKVAYYKYQSKHPSWAILDQGAYEIFEGEASLLNGSQRIGTRDIGRSCFVTIRCTNPIYDNLSLVFNKTKEFSFPAIQTLLEYLPQDSGWDVGIYSAPLPNHSTYGLEMDINTREVITILKQMNRNPMRLHLNLTMPCNEGITYDAASGNCTRVIPGIARPDGCMGRLNTLNEQRLSLKQGRYKQFHIAYDLRNHAPSLLVKPYLRQTVLEEIHSLFECAENFAAIMQGNMDHFLSLAVQTKLCKETFSAVKEALATQLKTVFNEGSERNKLLYRESEDILIKNMLESGVIFRIGKAPVEHNQAFFAMVKEMKFCVHSTGHVTMKHDYFKRFAQKQNVQLPNAVSSPRL
ncbi:MAG: tetratricopeptide repeat protein [Alphaproteobacteria bacterium]|nr:tetratricopeptide repeat protein [Alphaproteobacteria bacterium]